MNSPLLLILKLSKMKVHKFLIMKAVFPLARFTEKFRAGHVSASKHSISMVMKFDSKPMASSHASFNTRLIIQMAFASSIISKIMSKHFIHSTRKAIYNPLIMMNTSKKILFFGTEDFSAITLRGMIEAGVMPTAVVTKPDTKRGRSQTFTSPAVKLLAKQYNIPVWQPLKLIEIKDDIIALGDVAGVLVSYGKIIPQSILDLFTPGIINLHPSLLPNYRGPSPIESAIMNGDHTTGASIMQLSA